MFFDCEKYNVIVLDSEQSLLQTGLETRCNSDSSSQRARRIVHSRKGTVPPASDSERVDRSSSPENGSIVSPLKNFGPRRTALTPHNSFQSYFRPTVVPRARVLGTSALPDNDNAPPVNAECPLPRASPIPTSPSTPSQPGGAFRRQVTRETSVRQQTRPNGLPVLARQMVAVTPPATCRQRRLSYYDRPGTRLCRRNTVVGAAPVFFPQPLSLRDIYRLSRQGSIRSRHSLLVSRRSSIQSRGDGGQSLTPSRRTSSKASVSRHESSRSRVDASQINLVQSTSPTAAAASVNSDTRTTVETCVEMVVDDRLDSDCSRREVNSTLNETDGAIAVGHQNIASDTPPSYGSIILVTR